MSMTQNLDISRVSREIRNLVSRRRELMLFQGSLFAALSIYLQNVLEGKLPESLSALQPIAIRTYAIALLVPTVIIALRVARLHGGMVVNGVFYSRLEREIDPSADPARATRLNWWGVSAQFFLLCDLLAAFAAGLLVVTWGKNLGWASIASAGLFVILLMLFRRAHDSAARFVLPRVENAVVEPVDGEELEDHLSGSLEDCNHDMLTVLSFVGLVLFSVCESLSGLGAIQQGSDVSAAEVKSLGPPLFAYLLLATCIAGLVIYLRLSVSLGRFARRLDPSDQPFKPFRLTDSFLGYCLLAFFLAVAVHLVCVPVLAEGVWIWLVDAGSSAVAIVAYQALQLRYRLKPAASPTA